MTPAPQGPWSQFSLLDQGAPRRAACVSGHWRASPAVRCRQRQRQSHARFQATPAAERGPRDSTQTPSSATPRCRSELTSRFALLSFREFENARPVVVDRAGYRELVKQAIGRHLQHLTARVEQQSRGGRSWPRHPGRVGAPRRRHHLHQVAGVRSSVRCAWAQSVKLRAGRLVTAVMSPVGSELYGSTVERNCSVTACASSSGMP